MKDRITADEMYHTSAQYLLRDGFCEGEWVTLYKRITNHPISDERIEYDLWYWCYIANPQISYNLLNHYEPDLNWTQRSALYGDNSFVTYINEGMESLITVLRFDESSSRRMQIRIHEDFIYMFHLYEKIDENGNRYYISFDCGHEKLIITIKENEVKILHQYLYDFLAAKKMDLFCVIRSELNMPLELRDLIECKYNMTGHEGITLNPDAFSIVNMSNAITWYTFQSWFKGKKLFPYKKFGDFKSSFDSNYAEFIIGYNRDTCSEIKVKCNDDRMDYQRSFFNRSVLEKYRKESDVKVLPFYIDASPFYALKCNNDHPDFIWAYLKNLRCLPYNEQLHWAAYNILPPAKLSEEYQFDHYANWVAKARLTEFVFKDIFNQSNNKWFDAFGWQLFKDLNGTDRNAFDHLFSLGDNNIENFRSLIKTMNLVLSESINIEELKKLPFSYPNNSGGIRKLTVVLEANGYEMNMFINFLLNLNTLRSEFTDSHRNGTVVSKRLKDSLDFIGLSLDSPNFKKASVTLFKKGIEAFEYLSSIIPNISFEQKTSK